MSDLDDTRLKEITLGPWHRRASQDDVDSLVSEVNRHRAALRADKERIRRAVVDAVLEKNIADRSYYADLIGDDVIKRLFPESYDSTCFVLSDRDGWVMLASRDEAKVRAYGAQRSHETECYLHTITSDTIPETGSTISMRGAVERMVIMNDAERDAYTEFMRSR